MLTASADSDRLGLRAILDANFDSESRKAIARLEEFVGPRGEACFGVPYSSITQWGVKEEGCSAIPDGQEPHWVKEQAIWHWQRTFWTWLDLNARDKTQIAWREFPSIRQYDDGGWLVYARLAVM